MRIRNGIYRYICVQDVGWAYSKIGKGFYFTKYGSGHRNLKIVYINLLNILYDK